MAAEKVRTDFCTVCRKNTEYTLRKRNIIKIIKGKKYTFSITSAVCKECGEEMSLPGLIDKNIKEVDEQYRSCEGIVTIKDIEKLMQLYKLGKAPLSLALGFGEVTIARYLSGQMPSKEYSDIMRTALSSPAYMQKKLRENKNKISSPAYNKAMRSATRLKNLFSVSEKMIRVISYLFEKLEEITPLMLQKLLYFIQGVSFFLNDRPMFEENCQAWVHGPVYPKVYHLFRDFKYNPIEDARFAIFEGKANELTEDDRKVIDLVVNTFGEYGAKMLERITHSEDPWKNARKGCSDDMRSNALIPKKSIKAYYTDAGAKYGFSSEEGLKNYIRSVLR